MRKTILALMAVSAITFVGCEKEGPVTNTIEGTKFPVRMNLIGQCRARRAKALLLGPRA